MQRSKAKFASRWLLGAAFLGIAAEADAVVPVIGVEEVRYAWTPASGSPDGYLVSVSRTGGSPSFFRVVLEPSVVVPVAPGDRVVVQVQAGRAEANGALAFGPPSPLSEPAWVYASPELASEGQWTLYCDTCPSVALRSVSDASIVEAGAPGLAAPWRLVGRAEVASGSEALVWHHASGGIALWNAADFTAIQDGNFVVAPDMRYLGAADFDGDRVEEIAFFDPASQIVQIYGLTRRGLEHFGGVQGPAGAEPVALGDFTGDGAIEFAWLFDAVGVLELRPLDRPVRGRVASTLPSLTLLAGGIGDADVADSADYDGDGHLDLLLRRPGGELVVTYLTAGAYRRLVTLPAISGDAERRVVGSVDVDGRRGMEVALQSSTTGAISLLFPSDEQSADRLWVLTPGRRWSVADVR